MGAGMTDIKWTDTRATEPSANALRAARKRLDTAAMLCAKILDRGDDCTFHESQELENAALGLGRC